MTDTRTFTESSGNVFADLGVANPQDALLKAQLAHQISVAIREKGLTQTQAADALGIDQPKVSLLMRGRLGDFSVDRLLRFIVALDNDVDIVVRPKEATQAHGVVRVHDHAAAHAVLERARGGKFSSLRAAALIQAQSEGTHRSVRKVAARYQRAKSE